MRGTPYEFGGVWLKVATMTRGFQIVMAQPEDSGCMSRFQALTARVVTEGVYDATKLEEWHAFQRQALRAPPRT